MIRRQQIWTRSKGPDEKVEAVATVSPSNRAADAAPLRELRSFEQAKLALDAAWPTLVAEVRQVLAGELHYQAMAYHALRQSGVPLRQLGMNVKQWIADVVSPHFMALDLRKHPDFRGGFEPIPDIVLFHEDVAGDWRRRARAETLLKMLLVIELKASERQDSRLSRGEIERDLLKLDAQRAEVRHRGADFLPVMMIVDTAIAHRERMTPDALAACRAKAKQLNVAFFYVSQDEDARDWADADQQGETQ